MLFCFKFAGMFFLSMILYIFTFVCLELLTLFDMFFSKASDRIIAYRTLMIFGPPFCRRQNILEFRFVLFLVAFGML